MEILSSSSQPTSHRVDVLRRYFKVLPLETAIAVVDALDHSAAGRLDPASAAMLRRILRDLGAEPPSLWLVSLPVRDLLFRGLDSMIDDLAPDEPLLPGGIAHADIDVIWRWLSEHLLPADFEMALADVRLVLLSGDQGRIGQTLAATRRLVCHALRRGLGEDAPARSILRQGAGARAVDSAANWLALLEADAALGPL